MGKATLIMVAGLIGVLAIASNNLNESLAITNQNIIRQFADTHCRNIANSVSEFMLDKLGHDPTFRVNTLTTVSNIEGGSAEYKVIDTTITGLSFVKISVEANYLNSTQRSIVITEDKSNIGFNPPTVKAAVTTNNPLNTLGTLIVDGRDHTPTGGLIPNSGTLGIWTTSTLSVSGGSSVGGTSGGTDHSPHHHPHSSITAQGQVYPGGYPDTPDSILGGKANGYPAGTLKSFAQAGLNGSQYVTDPSNLHFPLSGVTYVELAPGGSWISANVWGEGILVVHNSSLNAALKNSNIGPFKGIVIADDIDKIHTDLLGAVISLSPHPPSGNTIGNGTGRVMYSSQAIINATQNVDSELLQHFGFGKKRVVINSWFE